VGENQAIRWGIIGCGDVCERKSGPAFQKAAGSRLVAVMRRDRGLAEDFARRHGVPRFTDDADALVADPEVDAVYVASPPGTHLEHALRACRAGKPVYVEKPMARSHAECLEMLRAFEEARLPLFVAYYRRALPKFLAMHELLAAGRVGALTGVVVRYAAPQHLGVANMAGRPPPWRFVAEHSGGGLLLDLGSHTLDLLDWWFGPLHSVQGSASNCASPVDVEDTVAMIFVTASGVPGVAHWSFASDTRTDCIDILGTNGRISVPTFGDGPVRVDGADGRGHAIEELHLPNPEHIQQPMVQAVVNALRGDGTAPSTGQSAARTSAVIDRVLLPYYGTREGAFWQAPEQWPGRRPLPR
jgi:predicted dehydrogenase